MRVYCPDIHCQHLPPTEKSVIGIGENVFSSIDFLNLYYEEEIINAHKRVWLFGYNILFIAGKQPPNGATLIFITIQCLYLHITCFTCLGILFFKNEYAFCLTSIYTILHSTKSIEIIIIVITSHN